MTEKLIATLYTKIHNCENVYIAEFINGEDSFTVKDSSLNEVLHTVSIKICELFKDKLSKNTKYKFESSALCLPEELQYIEVEVFLEDQFFRISSKYNRVSKIAWFFSESEQVLLRDLLKHMN